MKVISLMLERKFSPQALRTIVVLAACLGVGALAGCGGSNACCEPPAHVNQTGGVIPSGPGAPIVLTPPALQIGVGGGGTIGISGPPGPFTVTSCPGIVNATVNGNTVTITGTGVGTCVITVTSPSGGKGTGIITVTAAPPLAVTPVTLQLPPGGTGAVTVTGPGPFTATGCPGIINATVTGNVVNLVAVGAGVCVVVITGPGGIQATVVATVSATTPLVVTPSTINLGQGGTGTVVLAGTGPFTATGCPGIVNATVNGNVLNLAAVGVGVCVVLVTGPNGVQATVLATVSAATPLTVTPATLQLPVLGSGTVALTGTGPFTATSCPGIINATVTGNVLNLAAVGVGVCAVVVTGPNGVQATVLATVGATAPLALTPATLQLAPGGTGAVAIAGTGPFTATGCPGIVTAAVTGNVLNLTAVGVGACVVVVTGPNGVQATVLATVTATPPITVTPATVLLTPLIGAGTLTVGGTGPFTASGCPGIVSATVVGNVVNLVRLGVGVCVVVITGPGGIQATALVTST
ncbi:MAG: hypothetical protein GIW98_03600 [Candidatus Eremiobacteraeota bacterium]|nr:hypothetical protein [Candidatus Eremiobacteraeota bacterium]